MAENVKCSIWRRTFFSYQYARLTLLLLCSNNKRKEKRTKEPVHSAADRFKYPCTQCLFVFDISLSLSVIASDRIYFLFAVSTYSLYLFTAHAYWAIINVLLMNRKLCAKMFGPAHRKNATLCLLNWQWAKVFFSWIAAVLFEKISFSLLSLFIWFFILFLRSFSSSPRVKKQLLFKLCLCSARLFSFVPLWRKLTSFWRWWLKLK